MVRDDAIDLAREVPQVRLAPRRELLAQLPQQHLLAVEAAPDI